jgi:hypothetical protein
MSINKLKQKPEKKEESTAKLKSFGKGLSRLKTTSASVVAIQDRNRRADAQRLRQARKYSYFVILPDDTFRQWWDLIITLVLLVTFALTPYKVAFIDKDDTTWIIIESVIDFIFLIDIILNFFMAYYDIDYILVDKRKDIA